MENTFDINDLADVSQNQFDTLYKISQLLNFAEFQDTLVSDALDMAIQVLGAERGLFAKILNDKTYSIIAARNLDQQDITNVSEFSSNILHKVVELKEPVLYHDVQADPDISQFKSLNLHNINSIIGVPIFSEKKLWGVILVDSSKNRRYFNDSSLKFLRFFSNIVSLALDKIIRFEALQDENQLLRNKVKAMPPLPDMAGHSPAMQKVFELIHRVSQTDATVLLLGESGTGKELAAHAIHKTSARKNNPFVAQFCGSIPDTLLESELFGFKKGAFSGATTDKKGLFEVASGGTFFLDEIGDISMSTQTKLLRVLQNKEIIRIGETQIRKIDTRIIAATNQNLQSMISKGTFREDLYYRLNVFPIVLPPLRERRTDIGLLAHHFIKKYSTKDINIHPTAMRILETAVWPGNIRQLENVIQRAIILCDANTLLPEHLSLEDKQNDNFHGSLKDFEVQLLKKRLDEFDGNRTRAAESLGVSVRWVQMKLKEIEQ